MGGLPRRHALPLGLSLVVLVVPLLGEVGPCVPVEPVCPSGEQVDPATGQCAPGCVQSSDCPESWLCRPVECEDWGTQCAWQCLPPHAECWSWLDCERHVSCDKSAGCKDGSPFREWECLDFHCFPLALQNCNDENPCTLDTMDDATGCWNEPVDGLPCDDFDPCSVDDRCVAGACAGRPTETCAGSAADQCFDAVDNDDDGFTDFADPDCANVPCCPEG